MNDFRWFNQGQPQTLQIATFLCYFNGVFGLLFGIGLGLWALVGVLFALGWIASALGIANDKRPGYYLGVVLATLTLGFSLFSLFTGGAVIFALILNLIFEIALFAALIHPQSREYQKVWFH